MKYTKKHLDIVLDLFEGKEPNQYSKEEFCGFSYLMKVNGDHSFKLTLGMTHGRPIQTESVLVDEKSAMEMIPILAYFNNERIEEENKVHTLEEEL